MQPTTRIVAVARPTWDADNVVSIGAIPNATGMALQVDKRCPQTLCSDIQSKQNWRSSAWCVHGESSLNCCDNSVQISPTLLFWSLRGSYLCPAIQQERDWPVVDQFHVHHGTEYSGPDLEPRLLQQLGKDEDRVPQQSVVLRLLQNLVGDLSDNQPAA